MIETLFRAFVISQPLIWIWILEDERFNFFNLDGFVQGFNWSCFWVLLIIYLWKIEIGFYSNELLLLYIFMTFILANYLQKLNEGFRVALPLSFLLVYINSWYWESILHIWAINEFGLNMNQILQLLHLAPVPYLLFRWKFEVNESINWLMRGLIVSLGIAYIKFFRAWQYLPIVHSDLTVYWINHGLMIFNRLFCLYCLYRIFISHAILKNSE